MPPPYAIRVYTTGVGWQDISIVGPRGAQGDQGPVGPIGVAGPPGGVDASATHNRATVTNTTVASQAWTVLPIQTSVAITSSDGTNPDFVRNADGSLTVVKPGMYNISATVESAVVQPDNTNVNVLL